MKSSVNLFSREKPFFLLYVFKYTSLLRIRNTVYIFKYYHFKVDNVGMNATFIHWIFFNYEYE